MNCHLSTGSRFIAMIKGELKVLGKTGKYLFLWTGPFFFFGKNKSLKIKKINKINNTQKEKNKEPPIINVKTILMYIASLLWSTWNKVSSPNKLEKIRHFALILYLLGAVRVFRILIWFILNYSHRNSSANDVIMYTLLSDFF